MPLEDLFASYSNFSFDSYCNSGNKRTWVDCIWPDFLEKSLILNCEDFECYPSNIFDEDGPLILFLFVCMNHSSTENPLLVVQ